MVTLGTVHVLVFEEPLSLNKGSSLTRKRTPLEPYRRPMPRVLGEWASSSGRGTPVHGHTRKLSVVEHPLTGSGRHVAGVRRPRIDPRVTLFLTSPQLCAVLSSFEQSQ